MGGTGQFTIHAYSESDRSSGRGRSHDQRLLAERFGRRRQLDPERYQPLLGAGSTCALLRRPTHWGFLHSRLIWLSGAGSGTQEVCTAA